TRGSSKRHDEAHALYIAALDAPEDAPDVAISLLNDAIGIDPTKPIYYLTRATALIEDVQLFAALRDFDIASSMNTFEGTATIFLQIARCRLVLGFPSIALIAAQNARALDPFNLRATELLGRIRTLESQMAKYGRATSEKQWHVARSACDACLEIFAKEDSDAPPEIQCWGIDLLIVERKWDDALKVAEASLRSSPSSVEAMVLRALALFLQMRLGEALTQLIDALRFDPDNGAAKALRLRVKTTSSFNEAGHAASRRECWSEAIESWGKALQFVGDDTREGRGGIFRPTLLLERATAYLKMQQYSFGLKDVNQSLELRPSHYQALLCRARIHVCLELYNSAVEDFQSALEAGKSSMPPYERKQVEAELLDARTAHQREADQDHYTVLGLSEDCSPNDVKKAFRKLSLLHHPDKGGSEDKFKIINNAYGVLSDIDERAKYDLERRGCRFQPSFGGGFYDYDGWY
ncbi:DnaJ-domain-containing protein, partial [Epithele typhae]|uniref:DnaJ-domain-containing protein n=1 Tax=Epithele typhae TaxID=378194 RepID=UPI002007EF2A